MRTVLRELAGLVVLRSLAVLCFVAAAVLVAAVLSSCQAFGPEAKQTALQAFAQMQAEGTITTEQYNAIAQAIAFDDWGAVRDLLVYLGISIAGSLFGVRVWRGSVLARNGLSPPSSSPPSSSPPSSSGPPA